MATKSTKAAVVTVGGVTLIATLATALFLGGTPTASPTSIRSPTYGGQVSGYVAQTFYWDKSPTATGYRLYLNGAVIALYNGTGTTLSLPCGIRHRFNAQPYNNKGFAPLAPPVYVTPTCDKATT